MSAIKPPPMPEEKPPSSGPPRKRSGEHAAVKEMRAKFESIAEHTIPMAEALVTRVDELGTVISSHPPAEDSAPDTQPECTCDEKEGKPCPLHPKESAQ
jgi:hypothetical protein